MKMSHRCLRGLMTAGRQLRMQQKPCWWSWMGAVGEPMQSQAIACSPGKASPPTVTPGNFCSSNLLGFDSRQKAMFCCICWATSPHLSPLASMLWFISHHTSVVWLSLDFEQLQPRRVLFNFVANGWLRTLMFLIKGKTITFVLLQWLPCCFIGIQIMYLLLISIVCWQHGRVEKQRSETGFHWYFGMLKNCFLNVANLAILF